MIRASAFYGAAVWAIYGIVETLFIVFFPLLKRVLFAFALWQAPRGGEPFVNATLTAFVLAIYPLVGAVMGLSILLPLAFTESGRRVLLTADQATLWSSVGSLTLGITFALHALLSSQPSVASAALIPIALGLLRLAYAWRPRWQNEMSILTHPLTIVLTLVGTALIAQPRPHVMPPSRYMLGISYTAGVLLLAEVLHRAWTSTHLCRAIERRLPRSSTSLILVACAALTLTLLAGYVPRSRMRPHSFRGSRDGRPNVVLITLDTVRADHLSLYGYSLNTTPNLKRFAATNATLYTRAIASGNHTLPSHASIFTGHSPRSHGAHESNPDLLPHPISTNLVTLPELISQQGYRIAGIVSNFGSLTPAFGFGRGFSYYDCASPDDFFTLTGRPYLLREFVRNVAATVIAPSRREALFASAKSINERAGVFLEATARSHQPFFLFLNYMDAHVPYVPPHPFDMRYSGKDESFRWSEYQKIFEEVTVRHTRPLLDRERRHLVSQYDGSIAYLDDQLEHLFQKLRALKLFENSLIIITADHGEAFGESSIIGHGTSLYQHQVHVPLLIKYPQSQKAGTVAALVSSVDLLPTIMDVIGAPLPANTEGRSLRQVEPLATRWISSESYKPRGPGFTSTDARPSEIALFSGSFKQIIGAGGATELYDLSTDPNESANLYGRLVLPREWQATSATYMEEARSQTSTGPVTDPEVLNRLRALGYLQ